MYLAFLAYKPFLLAVLIAHNFLELDLITLQTLNCSAEKVNLPISKSLAYHLSKNREGIKINVVGEP